METVDSWALAPPELSDRDLSSIARLVYETSGINLHEGKRALIAARLQKCLRRGGFQSFRQYIRHVRSDETGSELTAMLDALATNHTSFFREPRHFGFLVDTVLPPLVAKDATIRGWSAGCASGEEPYTMAMLIVDAMGIEQSRRVRLLATDLSTKALGLAAAGIYKSARLRDVPLPLSRKYFAPGIGTQRGLARVVPAVRELVEFRWMNLVQPSLPIPPQDFIFCRNVMIYFDRAVQQRVISALEQRLAPGGYLFVSHSESLSGIEHRLRWVAPSIYRRELR